MAKIPYVREGKLYRADGQVVCGVGSKTGWFDWLGRRQSFRYYGEAGTHCTVVCERRKGSSGNVFYYWYAHRRIFGALQRIYLGRAEYLNLGKLEAAATKLAQLSFFDKAGGSLTTGEKEISGPGETRLPDETRTQGELPGASPTR